VKKLFALYFVFSFNFLLAQVEEGSTPFTNFGYGVYGGVNFEKFSEIGGNFLFEIKTNLTTNFNLLLSVGYYKSIEPVNNNIKTYGKATIDSVTYYQAVSFNVIKKNYDIFPLSIGFQYVLKYKILSPYLMAVLSYNFIDARSEITPGEVWSYSTFEEIPDEFKTKHIEAFPNNSYGIALWIGTSYHITNRIYIDFRYLYKFDSKIINTHNLLVGIAL